MEPHPNSPARGYIERDPRMKSPVLAIVLSAMPGLGQVYLGYYAQGFVHVLVVGSLLSILHAGPGGFEPLFGIFLAFFWLYNMVDAGRRAVFVNEALMGMDGPMPKGFGAADPTSTLVGGLAMILVGVLALAHILLGLSLDWLHRWWPLGLVLVGIYLIWRARKEAQAAKAASDQT